MAASLQADNHFVSGPDKTVTLAKGDRVSVEEFLQLLARAVRQFHTYPAISPLCTDAITACHKVFASLDRDDRLVLRVTPNELIVDEVGVGSGTIVEYELVRRLHRANIAALDIDRVASPRDLSRFCTDVIRCDDLAKSTTTLAELLVEHGVDTIVPRVAHRPEVVDIGAPPAPLCDLVEHERARHEAFAASTPASYLYPPDKGWVRLDPGARFDTVSLMDLTVLVDDPADVATILLRLTDDDQAGANAHQTALEQKFTDVTTLLAALDPRLARVMFEKLARAVLNLEPDRRKDLLQRTILPGLLDGRANGTVLRDFPDVDLAESLCLLLELETAAPEVLTAALDRLELPADRREAVVPLIDERLRAKTTPSEGRGKEPGIERHARRLVQVEAAANKDFAAFAAFDLSIDDEVAVAMAGVGETIASTDLPLTQLRCLWSLVRLEPNPGVVDAFLRRAVALFGELERGARWHDLAASASPYRQLADDLRERRPDVAEAISQALVAFCGPDRALALVALYASGAEGRQIANLLIDAFGLATVSGFVALLDDAALQSKTRPLVPLMCERAALFAPALALDLGRYGALATHAVVRILGFAGAGYEEAVAEQLDRGDEQTAREALRALARMGTAQAAALVARQLQSGNAGRRASAEEALWRFPPARTAVQVRDLLRSRDFVLQNPQTTARLLDRAAQAGADGLDRVLADLESLRFRFWNPGLARVGLKARELRAR